MCFIFVDFFLDILRLNFKCFIYILKIQKVDQVDFDFTVKILYNVSC